VNAELKSKSDLLAHGISLGMSGDSKYGKENEHPNTPVINLDLRWVVVDVDSAEGLGRFHRELHLRENNKPTTDGKQALAGVVAYVETDKGVLLVFTPQSVARCLFDGDIRYERMSQEREKYAMHAVSKLNTSKPRKMVSLEEDGQKLASIWNILALYAAINKSWAMLKLTYC
jgi:hypothetical protein